MTPDEIRARFAQAAAQRPATWNLEAGAGSAASLHLYGAIGGYWGGIEAADVVPAIRAADVDTLQVYINSPGGDVYDGIAIRNALRQHRAQIVVNVDGLAASAASFIAAAGDEVVMGANAEIMIHDAWTIALGNADDMRTVADDLDRISDNIAAMYAEKAGGTATEWRALMKEEIWYSADEAVAAGLADRTDAQQADAAAKFDLSMFAHAGRAQAPAPLEIAALASPRKEITMNRAQLAAALAAGTITPEAHAAALAGLEAFEASTAGQAAASLPAEVNAGPAPAPTPAAHATDRPLSFAQVADQIMASVRDEDVRGMVRTVNNALGTVLEGDDAGHGFIGRGQWLGEIWQAETAGRPTIESLGTITPLTDTKLRGWKWEQVGEPALYAGDLAEVPTGEFTTVPVEDDPERWAFGVKVDRIIRDLGSPDQIASLFAKIGAGYDRKSDARVRAKLLAGATTIAGGATSVLGGVTKSAIQLLKIGGAATRFKIAGDLFEDFAELKISDLPAWLANASGYVDLADASASLSSVLKVEADFTLPAGTMLSYDRRGATVFEAPQVRLEAQDIAHGGIDLGFFAYAGTLINDARTVVKVNVAAPAPQGA